jgi:hypothetical protein
MHGLGSDLNEYAYVHGSVYSAADPTGLVDGDAQSSADADLGKAAMEDIVKTTPGLSLWALVKLAAISVMAPSASSAEELGGDPDPAANAGGSGLTSDELGARLPDAIKRTDDYLVRERALAVLRDALPAQFRGAKELGENWKKFGGDPEEIRKTMSNYTTCVTLPPYMLSQLGDTKRGVRFEPGMGDSDDFVYANGENRPGPGDIYLIGIPSTDNKGVVHWEVRHIGVIVDASGEQHARDGREIWQTADAGQGIASRGEHKASYDIKRYYDPATDQLTGEKNQPNANRTMLIGWLDITKRVGNVGGSDTGIDPEVRDATQLYVWQNQSGWCDSHKGSPGCQ